MGIEGYKNIAVKQLSEDKHGLHHLGYAVWGVLINHYFIDNKENLSIRDLEKNLSTDT